VRVYEVLHDTDREGPAGDGTVIQRFTLAADAAAFADENTCWERPCSDPVARDVPRATARRWGLC